MLKAFALYEQLQSSPDTAIIDALLDLLPPGTDTSLFEASSAPKSPPRATILDDADEAFDDGQFDRWL